MGERDGMVILRRGTCEMPHGRLPPKLIGRRWASATGTRGGNGVGMLTVHGDGGAWGISRAAASPLGTLAAVMVRAGGFCPLLRVDGLAGRLSPWREVGEKPLLLCAAMAFEDVIGVRVLAVNPHGALAVPLRCVMRGKRGLAPMVAHWRSGSATIVAGGASPVARGVAAGGAGTPGLTVGLHGALQIGHAQTVDGDLRMHDLRVDGQQATKRYPSFSKGFWGGS
jgi:hypothetical protein